MFGWIKKKPPAPSGPDFSGIDSPAKVEVLLRRGDLEKLFLMPLELGGKDIAQNVVYVPVGLAAVKAGIDSRIIGLLAGKGKITEYKATPVYQGRSFIPIAIKIAASNPGEFTTTINIWGQALARGKEG
jgi:hypothetical protein